MNDIFHTETLIIQGHTVQIDYVVDFDTGAPWENCDGHGPVRRTNSRHADGVSDKRPSERPLNHAGRNDYQFYYDWQAACKLARADSWNAKPYDAAGQVNRAVLADFEYLKSWVNSDWHYAGAIVTLLDREGEELKNDSCWGFETLNDYHVTAGREIAADLVDGHIEAARLAWRAALVEARARRYWASRDIMTVPA